ncbi:Interferon-induced very large GTPase 1 (Very large-inducible GTPase-1) (VLIG-1) [Durusdinium trenchii]|uniref:Interferon-induced very large GTPase 1 (Very large-inducible GTPase-1) (VLIG-1) n=2 Tax=Durusdinium trenchii TaxID=1381693 RepID=A0ABP0LGG1_9DINO
MYFFESCLSSKNPLSAIAEMGHYLDAWKLPRVQPLLRRQRELLDELTDAPVVGRVHVPREPEETGGPKTPSGAGSGPAELNEVMGQLAELDFSGDTFWTELELLALREAREDLADPVQKTSGGFSRAATCWASLLASGQPFQVLHSRPLQMAGQFLRSVLASIGAPQTPGIFVVSVIGAQSSAKSTLLNFLFGSGFAVSSGRCTRGLYASYFASDSGRPVLVLDSEGLLSLGSEGSTFDGQIAMMCMTCSHLVLVNNKGELSRQLQDLLEVCLFAMKHLRLSRLQPRLVFVLRDQHDRSRSVHEDMLKQMKNNLEEAAKTLGSPLQDLILLDGTAVFLLPSAMSSELRQGREVCWTSELFAREVLKLRADVFRWLQEDCDRRGSELPEFSSLVHWYDYAATVWETLDQFGQQLLHCRTIHEIEQRRELADVAKSAVREALDGADQAGFHERARQLVDSFVSRIHSNPTRLDLETTDLELSRALAYLRDECVGQLEELFQQKASSPRFSATAKEQARQQIRTPIEWAFENHLYTWKLHLKKASDERAMHELWVHFTKVLNRHLDNSNHRSCLSEDESRELFESEWRMYEASFLERLQSLTKTWQTLAHEVTLLFNCAVNKLHHETGALALLKEAGPQQLAQLGPDNMRMRPLLEQSNAEWESSYFHIGWWGTMKMHGLALLHAGGNLSDVTLKSGSILHSVIPRMKQIVQHALQQLKSEVHARGVLDEATAADGLRHLASVTLHELESRALADRSESVSLKRPQILHALHLALRTTCVEALEEIETEKQKKAMADLLAQKALVEEHFLLIVQANKGDVERATNFATLYHRSLSSWLDHEVTQLAADVRSQVLQQMPDPQKSVEMAFQMSFGSRSWSDVLEYVLDTNAYLEKQFLNIFHQQKRSFVGAARSRVEKRVFSAYHLLQDVVGEWARKVVCPAEKVDIATASQGRDGRTDSSRRSIKELKDFISIHAEHVPTNADLAEAHRQLAERLPATADFQIADPKLFAETLQARISDFADSREIPKRLSEQLQKALREQSLQAWSLIRGCSERCPLCGSKCDLVGEHSRHHCAHHLFPAFHGWMDRRTGLPSFHHCLSCDTREGTYECRDGVWRKLEDYLQADHPSWLPFATDSAGAGGRDVQLLRAAWVNCREPLLEYFSPMADDCPEEWVKSYHEEGRALSRKDLDAAKDTIRKLRLRRWTPPE